MSQRISQKETEKMRNNLPLRNPGWAAVDLDTMEYIVIDDTFSIIERDWWAVSNELYNKVSLPILTMSLNQKFVTRSSHSFSTVTLSGTSLTL